MATHNLPQQPTPFIGRAAEIAEIAKRLDDPTCRLLTLVGPGGIGKTRLAIEVALAHLSIYPDGVYLVALQPIVSVENIVPTIASAIGFEFANNTDLVGQLHNYLRDQRVLLILDNFEFLIDAADEVAELLTATLQLEILVTSREALNLRDEWLFQVDGLSFPSSEQASALDGYDAVRLFAEHASRARRDFSLDDEYAHVSRICQLVQGMPLALELAASWCRRLPSSEIARELQRLDILKTDLRDMPDRHRSMRTVFDHSWAQLSDEEQAVLMGLSVFRGGFLRQAAEEVVGASLIILMSLVDKSILKVIDTGRYEIHELMRQYAEEKWDEILDLKVAIRDQHCAYYAEFMDRPVSDFIGVGNRKTLRVIDAEIDNVRSAWYWAVKRRRVSDLCQATAGLYWYTWARNWHEEGEAALGQAVAAMRTLEPTEANQIALADVQTYRGCMDIWLGPEARAHARARARESLNILRPLNARPELARALGVLGEATTVEGDQEAAKPLLQEAIPLLAETGQYELQIFYMRLLGRIAEDEGDYEAYGHWHQEALALGRRIGDQFGIAASLAALGDLARLRGQYRRARQLLQESLSVGQAAELNKVILFPRQKLGEIAMIAGEIDVASEHFEASLRIARDENASMQIAWSLTGVADALVLQGDHAIARQHYEEALKIIPDRGVRWGYARALSGLGDLAWHEGHFAEAWQLHEESLQLQRQNNVRSDIIRNLTALGRIALARNDSARTASYFHQALHEAIPPGFLPAILSVLVGVAELFMQQGDLADAIRLAALVAQHAVSPVEAKDRANTIFNQLVTQLFATDLATALQQGSQADLKDIAVQVLEQLASSLDQPLIAPLSKRELEVLHLVASGMTNKEIAGELVLSVGTVKRHVYNISAKLDVRNRTQAVERARELSLL